MDCSRQVLCPWAFSGREYWSGLPCRPPGDLPNPGIKLGSPTLQVDSLPAELPGKSTVSGPYRDRTRDLGVISASL